MAEPILPESSFISGNNALDILNRMLIGLPQNYDKAEGSILWDWFAAFSFELESVYLTMDFLMNQAFVQTATGVYLDALGEEMGLLRKLGTYASVTLLFTGTEGAVIPIGTRVSNVIPAGASGSPIAFQTTQEGAIAGGFVSIPAQAVDIGEAGNLSASSITRIETGVAGIIGVTNLAAGFGGVDPEDDQVYRDRLLSRAKTGRGAGTPGDYIAWATSVEGVGHAFADSPSPGAVKVLVEDENYSPVTPTALANVTAYLESIRPINVALTVTTPSTDPLTVSATVTLEEAFTLSQVFPAIEQAVRNYLRAIKPGGLVYLTELGAMIVTTPGIADYSNLRINSVAGNYQLSENTKAVLDVNSDSSGLILS